MANKLNPEVHPSQHLSGNNNPQNIDIAQSTLLTVKMDAHDSIRFRAVDKSVSMQHLSFTRQGSDLHVFLDNGHQAAIIEDYFNNPVNIYALDEQDMPHLYLANGTDVYDLAHLADGESTTQTLSPVPTSDDSVTDFSAEDSIMLGGEDDDDDRDGFFAGLISDGALAIAGGIAAAGLAGVAIASANNKGKGDSHENKHQADTTPPAAIHADDIRVTDDAGNRINAGGMTADSTPTVSGRVDAAEAGGKVIIRDNGIAIGEATIGKDGSWSMTVSPALKDGTHNLSAVVVDKAGNHSLPSENIDIGVDTIAPNQASDIVLTDDHGKVIGEVTNDKTPTVSGKGEADATVVLKDGDKELGSTTVDKDGNWTITSGALADGDHALSVEQSDKAGNTSVVHLPTLNIDTEIAPIGDITLTDKNGNTLVDGATNTGTPDISGKGEAGSTVTITDEKGSEVGSTTVDKDGNWTIKPEKPLGEGNHDLIVDVTDPAGNHTSASLPVSIDSIAPNPAENIIITDDRGEVIVTLTNDSTPTVSGEGEPGATVTLKDDAGNILGSAIVKENGSWVITPDDAHALADGDHALSVELSDKSGNTSTVTLQPIAIDTQAPDRATDIKVTDDANEEISDLTKDNTPTVSGKGEPHAIVTLKDSDGSTLGSTIVGADGSWVITTDDTHALTDGDHALKVELRDEAGNASEVALDVITVVTRVPEAVDNIVITDDGGETIEGITNDTTPTVSGTGQPGTIVELKDVDNNVLGSATTDINGNWRIELDKELTDGKHALTVVQTDKAGNTSAAASLSEIEIDTTAPVAVKDITITDDNNDAIGEATNDTTPTISGEGEPGANVKLLDSKGTELGSATVGADGRWIITPKSELTDGKHALTVVQTDKAGNTSAAASVPEFEIDTKAPTAVEAIVVTSDDNLPIVNITNDSTPTVSGEGEPGATVDLLDSKGTTLGSATVGADGSWSITPDALTDGKYSLSVVQTDKAGNTSAAAAVPEIEVDTKAPDAVKGITIMDDNNDAIGETTNDTTPTVSGTGEPGATVTLKDDKDITLGTTTVNADGSWSITPEALKDGEYKLQVVQTDKAGNTSAVASLQPITIDTLPPDAVKGVVIRDDAGNEIKDFTNDSTPTVSGKGMAGATIELKDDKDNLLGTTTVGADGKWSITPDALSDADYHLKVVQTSKAGNSSSFDVPGFTIDTAAPTAVEAIVVTGDDNLPIGSITNDTMPTVSGEGEPGATVDLLDSKGTKLGSATVGADGNWSITPETALTDGKYSLSVVQTDKAGNTSAAAAVPEIEIDTTAPVAVKDITITDDNNDAIGEATNDTTPTISGEGEPGATVKLLDSKGTELGSATVGADGRWIITPKSELTDGKHALTVVQTDKAGNTSAAASVPEFEIDTKAPTAVEAIVVTGDDNLPIGSITNDTMPTVSGEGEPGAIVTLKDSKDATLGTATVGADGRWSITPDALTDGKYSLSVVQTDKAGNTSTPAAVPEIEIDTQAPPQAENIMLTDKNGDAVTGTNTNTKTPVISGEAEPESTVTITDKTGTIIGSAKADKDGHWSITPENALAENDQTLTVTVKDAAGNTTSSSLAVNVDSVAPDAPDNVTAINDRSGEDVTVVDGLTNDNTVALTGHAEKNSLITIRDGETVLGTATADDKGNWRFELPEEKKLKDGDHSLIVTSTDGFNNVSDETSLPLRVDTTNNNVTTLNTLDGSNSTITDIPRVNGKVDLKDGDSPESVKVLIFDDVDGDGIYDKNVDKLLATVDNIGADGSWNAQLKSMTEGEHHIKAVVVDAAGNYSSVSSLNGSSDGSLEVNAPERTTLSGYNEGTTGTYTAQFGTVVKNIGHFSGDGYDDIAISAPSGGAPGKANWGGMVYVLFGNKTGLLNQYSDVHKLFEEHPEVGLRIYNSGTTKDGNNIAAPTTDRMAQDIVKIDLNGDGIDDLVIASHWNDKLYVIWGDKIRDSQLSDLDLHEIDLGNNKYGFSVTVDSDDWFAYSNAAYDYNGDGVQDLVIGNIDGAYDAAGAAYVLKGSNDPQHQWSNIKLNKTKSDAEHPGGGFASDKGEEDGFYIHHEVQGSKTQNQNFGNAMQSVGDVNGDGFEDFIIIDDVSVHDGCYGTAYLIYGQEGGINKTINISSLDEHHMVRIQNMNTTWFGAVDPGTVIAGGPSAGIETEPNQKVIASLGDFYNDGDKTSDFAIAAPQDAARGKVWIFRGKSEIGTHGELQVGASGNNHLASDDGFAIVSSNKSGTKSFGSRILGTYDINGDGIPDLIISDPTAINAAGKAVGAVYVVYGGHTADYVMDSNNEISIDTLLQKGLAEVHWGEVSNGHFGSDLDVADMNGDGRMDIIVGANGQYNATTGNGAVTIIYNHHDVVESKAAAIGRMSLEPESHNATDAGTLILDGDHQNVDLASLTQALKTLHHVDLADGENTLTVSSDEVKTLSEGQDASAPALTIEGENGNVALTGGQENWQEGGKVEVNGTVYQAWESSSHSQILVDDRIHVTVL
ncbi:hypothetical protein CRM79_22200 [Pantoea agglomerans]|nr:Ig-like domain-containing protein [Pantoea agglomerans]PEI02166.1 hypothetical protein CRM79_22200 [Pantoea agglomerans]